jgi:SAM-dependent methyltransferase
MSKLILAEKKILTTVASTLRGYHLLLVGKHRALDWLPKNRLHNFSVSPKEGSHVLSHYETLPFRNNSIDIAFVPYELEHCKHPQELLHELNRCLLSSGKLFIFAHQPWHPLNFFKKTFFSMPIFKLKHLLESSDFEIQKTQWLHYGSAVFIQAQKNIPGITPIKPKWEKELILEKHWQPTTRKIHD